MAPHPEQLSPMQRVLVGAGLTALAVLSIDLLYIDPVNRHAIHEAKDDIKAWQTDPNHDTDYYQELSERQAVRADAEEALSNTKQRIIYEISTTMGTLAATALAEGVYRRRAARPKI